MYMYVEGATNFCSDCDDISQLYSQPYSILPMGPEPPKEMNTIGCQLLVISTLRIHIPQFGPLYANEIPEVSLLTVTGHTNNQTASISDQCFAHTLLREI